jgi:glycosyltransferase involved in cell wall biosynthesis
MRTVLSTNGGVRVLVGVHEGGFTGIDTYSEQVAIAGAVTGNDVTLVVSTPALARQVQARLSGTSICVIDLGLPELTPREKRLNRLWPQFGLQRLQRGLMHMLDSLPARFPVAHLNHPGLATSVRPYVDRVCVAAWFYPHHPTKRIMETWRHTGGHGARSLALSTKSIAHYLNDSRGYRHSDCVTAPTELLAEQLAQQGIDAVVCPPPVGSIPDSHGGFGVEVQSKVATEPSPVIRLLLCAGDLSHPRKNIAAALRSVRLLPFTGQSIAVELIGGHGDELRGIVSGMPTHIAVSFTGPLTRGEVQAHMRASDALLLPSLFEEWGYVAVESMLCGTPVIAFPVYPFHEMLASGFGAKARDMSDEAFAEAVQRVLVEGPFPELAAMATERFGSVAVGHRLTEIWLQ